jgi:serine/threonine-protein kinase RsbW
VETPFLRLNMELPDEAQSVPLCRRTLRFMLNELAVPEARAADIELALSEATTNVVRHAYSEAGHNYRVIVEFCSACVRLVVTDTGRGFSRTDVPEPDLGVVGGRGIWLIEQLADAATITSTPLGGCRLEAEFSLPQPVIYP